MGTRVHRRLLIVLIMGVFVAGCGRVASKADAKFGDQHFKTVVALVELYHVRHGVYPASLTELDFTGEWDQIAISAVTYHRLPDGYELDIARGWIGEPTLAYPKEFWQGLGLRRSNVRHLSPAT